MAIPSYREKKDSVTLVAPAAREVLFLPSTVNCQQPKLVAVLRFGRSWEVEAWREPDSQPCLTLLERGAREERLKSSMSRIQTKTAVGFEVQLARRKARPAVALSGACRNWIM
jgi:hypothetical protein